MTRRRARAESPIGHRRVLDWTRLSGRVGVRVLRGGVWAALTAIAWAGSPASVRAQPRPPVPHATSTPAAPPTKPAAHGPRPAAAKAKASADKYAATPKQPGTLKLVRSGRTVTIALVKEGKVSPEGLDALTGAFAHKSGAKRPVDEKLALLLASVSDHFGGRALHILEGFRPPPGHSNHNVGKAVDFRIEGVPVEVLRDFCLTLDGAGVGYYPNGKFVHLDSRRTSRSWTDDSPPAKARSSATKPPPASPAKTPGSGRTPSLPPQAPANKK